MLLNTGGMWDDVVKWRDNSFLTLGLFFSVITTSNTFTLTDVHPGGEEFKIRVFNQDCPQDTSTYYINVVSNTTINLSANNNPSCSGENQNFTATGSGNWFEFLVLSGGVLSLQIASESNTWSSTSLLNNDVVYVRSYFSSSSVCYSEDSATIIINSITGSNSITGNQTICPDLFIFVYVCLALLQFSIP